ncbi:WD40 repeat domain-containing protein [Sphaerisporangium sp. NPDC005289]|uniref:WD40 repeat domain-containing protein n=1 Tax=Sphaerisporangium sp. NPDC005289 TaxID=3155247 RepID=UPI0033AC4E3D
MTLDTPGRPPGEPAYRTATSEMLRERFVGRGQEWVAEVAACLRDSPDELPSLLPRPGDEHWRALEAESGVRWQDEDPLEPPRGVHPWCSAAYAVVGVARALAEPVRHLKLLEEALAHWERAGCMSVSSTGVLVTRQDELPGSTRDLLLRLQAAGPHPSAPFAALMAVRLSEVQVRHEESVRVPVLVDRGGEGARLVLWLRARPGPPGLHPDPDSMAFTVTDPAFMEALRNAWNLSPIAGTARCVTWAVLDDEQPCNDIHGNSIGAAAGVALHELAALRGRRLLAPRRLRGLDPRCAVTGALDHKGTMEAVGGYSRKLEAARDARLRVVLPAASQQDHEHLASELGVPAVWAADLDEAIALSRTGLVKPLVWSGALVAMLTAFAAAAAIAIRAGGDADRERALALARVAQNQSRQVAADSEVPFQHPAISARLAAAAWAVAPTGEARAALAEVAGLPGRAVLTGHDGVVVDVAFSPDGTRIATAGDDGTVRLWDAGARKQIGAPLNEPDNDESAVALGAVAFSPDGARLATAGDDGAVHLWDVTNHQEIGTPRDGHDGTVDDVAFSPDGTRIATAGEDGTVRLWDATTRRQLGTPLKGHGESVEEVEFSPDGRRLATAGQDMTVRLWDASTHEQLGPPLPYKEDVLSVAFSPGGAQLATLGLDDTVRVWDLTGRKQVGVPLKGNNATDVAFSPDGSRLATAGADGTIRLWDAGNHRQLGAPLAGHTGSVLALAFSPDGARLASTGWDGTARLWDASIYRQLGAPLARANRRFSAVAVSPDGARLATGGADGTVCIWDARTGRKLGVPLIGHHELVYAVVFSPDGSRLASAGQDWTVRLWGIAGHEPLGVLRTSHVDPVLKGSSDSVETLAFSADGARLVTAMLDETLRWWDVGARKQDGPLLTSHVDAVQSVAVARDGSRLASGGTDGTVRVWDVATHRQLGAPLTGHNGPVPEVAFSPDGTRLASAGEDGSVRIWDVTAGRQVGAPLLGHEGEVSSVSFSPDGARLASAGHDGTVRVWDVATHRQLGAPLTGHNGPVLDAVFFPDGTRLVTVGYDGTVRFWDVTSPRDLLGAVCGIAGRGFTPEEWRQRIHGVAYRPSCPGDKPG